MIAFLQLQHCSFKFVLAMDIWAALLLASFALLSGLRRLDNLLQR